MALTLVAVATSALCDVAPSRPASVTDPQWIEKPTGADVDKFYPPLAQAAGLSGSVNIKCKVDLSGFVRDCTILSETPAGLGFGDAALKLSALFRMTPQKLNKVAVANAEVSIPIQFKPGETPWATARITRQVTWIEQPESAAHDAARPAGLPAPAMAVLRCGLDHAAKALGRLTGCMVVKDLPEDKGVGAAALKLTDGFRADAASVAASSPGSAVELFITWRGVKTPVTEGPQPKSAPSP